MNYKFHLHFDYNQLDQQIEYDFSFPTSDIVNNALSYEEYQHGHPSFLPNDLQWMHLYKKRLGFHYIFESAEKFIQDIKTMDDRRFGLH